MKKPTKPPPPPPPPPKHGKISPVCSVASLPRQNCCWNGSEYAESVSSISYSTRSLQPPMRCTSPSNYQTCRSESGFRVGSTLGSSSCRTCCSSIQQSSQNCCCHGSSCLSNSTRTSCGIASLVYDRQRAVSPCGTVHSHHSRVSASMNCGHSSYSPQQLSSCYECESCSSRPSPSSKQFLQHNQHGAHNHSGLIPEYQALSESSRGMNENVPIPPPHKYVRENHIHRVDVVDTVVGSDVGTKPPIPKERIIRPKMSVSPLPRLKRTRDSNRRDVKESYKKCKPSQYRRHMDLHIQTIFKYLADREIRRKNLEAKLSMNERSDDTLKEIEKMSFRKRESNYLRSLRSKMSSDDFKTIDKLGQGYMGSVSLVEKRSLNGDESDLFAMKKIKKSQVYQENHMAHVMAERDILAEADNEWIVKLYYSFQDEQNLYFILEYLPGGDMINLLKEKGFFTEEWARFYVAEISLAVQFVHNLGYIHRDIKPDNILIDANGHLKLTDFGLCTGFRWTHDSRYYNDDTVGATLNSTKLTSFQTGDNRSDEHMTITRELTKRDIEHSRQPRTLSLVGSPNYIAPEVLRQACHRQPSSSGKLCDWWSVGVILYEMVVGYCPFLDLKNTDEEYYQANSPEKVQHRILSWKEYLKFRTLYDESSKPRQLSGEIVDLIRRLICDPEDRLCQNGIGDMQVHPFFKGLDWVGIRSTEAPCKPNLTSKYDTSYFSLDYQPEPSFNSSKAHGNMAHFTYKNFYA